MDPTIETGAPVVHAVLPYLCVRGAARAIDFYAHVFGAKEKLRLTDDQGRVSHAELQLGPATLMLADEHPEIGILSPLACGGTGLRLHLHVDDVDALARRAAASGATILLEPTDFPHGERQCRLRDPFGHEWLLGDQVEEVPPEEIRRRVEGKA
ncbi:MAG TPA: VOC family protein [Longimicrobiales bacterium]